MFMDLNVVKDLGHFLSQMLKETQGLPHRLYYLCLFSVSEEAKYRAKAKLSNNGHTMHYFEYDGELVH